MTASAPLARLLGQARRLNAIAATDEGAFPEGSAPLVLVKDNIAVAGMPWTAGSPFFADVVASRDAAAVRLLRMEGGCFPVKTTLHELAFGVTGANGWTGAIVNPHDRARVAGGSSGGSAAALALGLGDLSLVTDTGGSARVPAAFCGVTGFRPTTGRYPADGMIALTPSRDTIGLMARDLRWIAWADTILADEPAGRAMLPSRPLRIGIAQGEALGVLEPAVAEAYAELADRLAGGGHAVVPVDLAPIFALDEACGFAIALYESHQSLLASAPALTGRSFDDLLASVATPDVAHLLHLASDGQAVPPAAYAGAIGHHWPALQQAYARLFADAVDLLLLPTTPVVAPPLDTGETLTLDGQDVPAFPTITRFTRPDSMAGLPSISLPYGVDREGLPIGMMLVGPRNADRLVLAFARGVLELPGMPQTVAPHVSFP